ncbi:MAG: MOSC domain-containing protein [Alphaproteobacteria bacterium]|nr:MOSC domain-containing protein [Alphaproteobacteria bacterium]
MLRCNMVDAPSRRVAALYRYPVKGLTGEALDAVTLAPGHGFPEDRRFAIALGTTAYDQTEPVWLPKAAFFQLARHERLALLSSRFDPESGTLSLSRGGKLVAHGKATEPQGRAIIGEFLSAFLDAGQGRPRLVEGPPIGLADCGESVVSIIGEASIADLARVVGKPVEQLRFRANVYVSGTKPWDEFGWVGQEISVGSTRLQVMDRIGRCAATNVDPFTAERDMNLPLALQRAFDHADMGVYARVVGGGRIAVGDALELIPA